MPTDHGPTKGHATLCGNLTADPELRYSNKGTPWLTARLAVNRRVRQDDGTYSDAPPDYYELVAFAELAEHAADCLMKGNRVIATGRIEEDHWRGNDGTERVTVKCICDDLGPSLRFAVTTIEKAPGTERPAPAGARGHTDEGSPDEPF